MGTDARIAEMPLKDSIAQSLAVEKSFTIFAKPSPVRQEVLQSVAQVGMTLAEIVQGLDQSYLEITVNGEAIPQEWWPRLKPKQGATVNIFSYPKGKTVKKLVAIVVVAVVIYFTGPASASFWAGTGMSATAISAAQIAISVVGMLAVQALVKPTIPKQDVATGSSDGEIDRQNAITGAQNAFAPYGVQPCVIGEHRFFPPNCAMPYTEMVGDDQYLRMLLDLGPGSLDVTEVCIGDDDISTFEDVEWQFGTTPSLYSNDVVELPVGINLPNDFDISPPKTAAALANEIVVEVAWPQGLYGVTAEGKDVLVTQNFWVQYRLQGSPTWLNMARPAVASSLTISHPSVVGSRPNDCFQVSSSARKMIRCSLRLKVTPNALPYEVRVLREGTNFGLSDSRARMADFGWVSLKSIKYTVPCTLNSTKLAVRIKASDQLNGTISTLNVRAKQQIKLWNGTGYEVSHTNNPAWIYLWLLTACPANPRKVPEERVDLEELKLWATACTNAGLSYCGVLDAQTTLFDLIQDVCAAGRASFHIRDNMYSIVRDVQQSVPVQVFTPRNTWDFSGTRTFGEKLHALRCGFVNRAAGWQRDERLVYAPGYNASNATNIENFEMRGITFPDAIWRLASYHMEVADKRQNLYSFKCDFENLICQRGDLILVSHPLCNWGYGWGRVVTMDASPTNSFTLDEDIALLPFKDNVLRVRKGFDRTTEVSSVRTNNMIYHYSTSFSRASEASFRGFDGLLTYAEPNEARFAYDAQGNALGVLFERASTNLLTWSELLTDPVWLKNSTTVDFTGGLAPDGTSLANTLRATTSSLEHSITQNDANNSTGVRTLSVWAKNDGMRYLGLRFAINSSTNYVTQVFDLNNKIPVVAGSAGTGFTVLETKVDDWTDGWMRLSFTVQQNTASTFSVSAILCNSNSLATFAGNPAVGIQLWGFQLELQDHASSYISTSGATVTRASDFATMPFNDSNATMVTEFYPLKQNTTFSASQCVPFSIDDGTTNNRITPYINITSSAAGLIVVTGGTTQANLGGTNLDSPTKYKMAFTYGTNDFRLSINGGAVISDTAGTVPSHNRIVFGQSASTTYLEGYLRSVFLYVTPQSNAALQNLSDPTTEIDESTLFTAVGLTNVTEGDLVVIGTLNEETSRMIVTKIEPSSNLTATITCVDEAPSVYTAGTGTPPGFISTITNQPYCKPPPPPLITGTYDVGTGTKLFGDHFNVGGVATPKIRVALRTAEAPRQKSLVLPAGVVEATGSAGGFCSVGGATLFNTVMTATSAGTSPCTGVGANRRITTASGTGVNVTTGIGATRIARVASAVGTCLPTGASSAPPITVAADGVSKNDKLPDSLVRFQGANGSTIVLDDDNSGRLWTTHGTQRLDNAVADPFGGSGTSLLCEGVGNGGYLSTPHDPVIDITTGDFTMEMAIRPGTITAFQQWLDYRNVTSATATQGCILSQTAAAPDRLRWQVGSASAIWEVEIQSTTVLTANTWYHVTMQRRGSTFSLYINGVLQGTATYSGDISISGGLLQMGANRTNNGWVQGRYGFFRMVAEALYTGSTHTLPSSHYTYKGGGVRGRYGTASQMIEASGLSIGTSTQTANTAVKLARAVTMLSVGTATGQIINANAPVSETTGSAPVVRAPRILMRFDGAANDAIYTNDGPMPFFALAGAPRLTSSNALFPGKTSLAFVRANSEAIFCNHDPYIDIATGDFTLAWWIFPQSVTTFNPWWGYSNSASNVGMLMNQPTADPTKIRVAAGDSNSTTFNVDLTSTDSMTLNTWNHVEFVRNGDNFYLFLNGVLQSSTTAAGLVIDLPAGTTMRFGQNFGGTSFVSGQLGSFLLHRSALHTATFAVPNIQYPYIGVSTYGKSGRLAQGIGSITNVGVATGAGEAVTGGGGGPNDPPPSGTLTALHNESGTLLQNDLGTNLEGDIT